MIEAEVVIQESGKIVGEEKGGLPCKSLAI